MVKKIAKEDCNKVHWSYHNGENGPENWENLCVGFADCGGNSQSPVDIVTQKAVADNELVTPKFRYGKNKVNIINNHHTIQFNVGGNNKVYLNGKDYELLQFHYHALSEHTIDNQHFPIEAHFVHKHSDTDFAVIAVMLTEGEESKFFKRYLDQFPVEKWEYKTDEMFDLLSLFPENRSYYHYSGSLTTPPCTEFVSWYVMKNPVEASREQIEKFSEILHNNYRPVMPLNGRKVKIFEEG